MLVAEVEGELLIEPARVPEMTEAAVARHCERKGDEFCNAHRIWCLNLHIRISGVGNGLGLKRLLANGCLSKSLRR